MQQCGIAPACQPLVDAVSTSNNFAVLSTDDDSTDADGDETVYDEDEECSDDGKVEIADTKMSAYTSPSKQTV